MTYSELQQPITLKKTTIFRNLTGRYLLPQTKLLGAEFASHFASTDWLAYGLCDRKYEHYTEYDNKLFMLASNQSDLGYWIDNYEYYLFQDGETDKVMIIIDLPINNRDNFLMGNYSELYEDVPRLFQKYSYKGGVEFLSSSYCVLTKADEAREQFQNQVNKDFNLSPLQVVSENQEYEYPPVMNREIFNA
jgi:hypothetical protein